MMKAIRILSLILALLMLAMPLVACNDETPDETPAGDQPAEEVKDLRLVTNGEAKYDVVYDYKASPAVKDAVNALVDAYKTYLNCENITVRECYSDQENVSDDIVMDNEILIGATNRPESQKVIEGKRAGDYSMSIEGTKFVIAGGSDDATATAVVRFLTAFVYEQGDKAAVKKGAKLSLKVDQETAATLTNEGRYSYSKAVLCGARIDSYAVLYPQVSDHADSYKSFAEKIQSTIYKEAGYEVDVYKDANVVKIDYQILVGDTTLTDPELIAKIGENDYHIELKATETGAVLTIHYGEMAEAAALKAFKEIFPSSSTPIEIDLAEGVLKTTLK